MKRVVRDTFLRFCKSQFLPPICSPKSLLKSSAAAFLASLAVVSLKTANSRHMLATHSAPKSSISLGQTTNSAESESLNARRFLTNYQIIAPPIGNPIKDRPLLVTNEFVKSPMMFTDRTTTAVR
jgi:hypothetical protein